MVLFINQTGSIGLIVTALTTNTTGTDFLTYLLILFVLVVIGFMFRMSIDLIALLLTPLVLVLMAFNPEMIPIGIVILIMDGVLLARNIFFTRWTMKWQIIIYSVISLLIINSAYALYDRQDILLVGGTTINITNNITGNITNNITNTIYINLTNNITNNISIENNITNNFYTTIENNITNNITQNFTTINNITTNLTAGDGINITDNNISILLSYLDVFYYPLNINPSGYINSTYANSTYYFSTNPSGYINYTEANATFYPNSNPQGYINITYVNDRVIRTGDNITGTINFTNNNITDVNTLFVHNITGRSPIQIGSDIISSQSITAGNFIGNISATNGTIFGAVITNGTIQNLKVSDSAHFDTDVFYNGSLYPDMNDTYTLGNETLQWKRLYVGDLYVGNIVGFNQTFYITNNITINTTYNITNNLTQNITINITNNITAVYNVTNKTLNTNCITIAGNCEIITTNINFQITEIKIQPTSPNNNYRFQATEYPTNNIIDKDRIPHNGVWDIEKSYALNSQVNLTITSANINEQFNMTIIYLQNGGP